METRIGILQCDHVADDLIYNHGDYQDMFADLLLTQDHNIEISIYDLTVDQFPVDLTSCDGYIITGSKFCAFDDVPWIHKTKKLVNDLFQAGIPTIGICFGHQIIAEALGGKVKRATDKGWGVGVHKWNVINTQSWMQNKTPGSISMLASHQDQVVVMPNKASLIASSYFCPIAGFQKGNILTLQGHPEFSKDYLSALIKKRAIQIDEAVSELAIKSLEKEVDTDIVSSWMVAFLKKSHA